MSPREEKPGLVVVLTGDGKGKTTSALGMGLRACGHGMRVAFLQFVKSSRNYGEGISVRSVPGFEFEVLGVGYVGIMGDKKSKQEHIDAAKAALAVATEKALSGHYDMIVLDEINLALSLGLLQVEDVLSLIEDKPKGLHLILTGRGAPEDILERADVVTEFKDVKHPFHRGEAAREGIEY